VKRQRRTGSRGRWGGRESKTSEKKSKEKGNANAQFGPYTERGEKKEGGRFRRTPIEKAVGIRGGERRAPYA